PYARVTATAQNFGIEVTADEHGDFVFDDLEPGEYLLHVEAEGFEPNDYPDLVQVAVDEMSSPFCPFLYPLTGVQEPNPARVETRNLIAVGPNPCPGPAQVRWQVSRPSRGSVSIVDNTGRTVRMLASGLMAPGAHTATWDGCDQTGEQVSRGIYFVRVDAGSESGMAKLVVVER
ncbi:MAG: carboxypeptidase regulatory-like domain-containing protein, partial [candidate division WOR-3 bacterium]